MPLLKHLLPTPELVLESPLEVLAGLILQALALQLRQTHDTECANNFGISIGNEYGSNGGRHSGVKQVCLEAWDWLYVNGLIGHHADHGENWMTLTRKGRAAAAQPAFSRWIAEREFPEGMLSAHLRGPALSLFRQGLFEASVFEAFKTLEVAIRDGAKLGHDLIGVGLASRAFHVDDGPLTDRSAEKGERVALMQLMTGALGSYKNPHSHRRVEIAAAEAREMLLLASHLLRIVESRVSRFAVDKPPAI